MKTIRHGRNARDKLLHIEADGVLVNIHVGLTDMDGRHVTNVSVSPDDRSTGGDGSGHYWYQDGARIIRLHPGEEPPALEPAPGLIPGTICEHSGTRLHVMDGSGHCRYCGKDLVLVAIDLPQARSDPMNGTDVPDYGGRTVFENAARMAQDVIERATRLPDGTRGPNPEWEARGEVYAKSSRRVEEYMIAGNGPSAWLCFVFHIDNELAYAYLRYVSSGDPAIIHFGQYDGEVLYQQVKRYR